MFWKFLFIKRQIVHLRYIHSHYINFVISSHVPVRWKKHWFDLIVWLLWYDIDYRYIWHSDIMSYVSCCLLAKYWYLCWCDECHGLLTGTKSDCNAQKVAKDAKINKEKNKVLCYIPVIVRLLFWRFNRNTFWWKYIKHVELIKTLT